MTVHETLHVKNFAGIKDAQIELSRMNVFIGPQASGKSVCAKLLFYFKNIRHRMPSMAMDGLTMQQMREEHQNRFLKYFPASNWPKGVFQITYSDGLGWISVERKGNRSHTISVSYSVRWKEVLEVVRQDEQQYGVENAPTKTSSFIEQAMIEDWAKQTVRYSLEHNYFIPAGRSFFSTLRSNVFAFIADDVGIDPFLAEFGRLYEIARRYYSERYGNEYTNSKQIKNHINKLICGTYKRTGQKDYILSEDGRQVALESSSSGQQEVLPLALTILALDSNEGLLRRTIFVEEPEAHLYPVAQREIVHLLAAATDLASDETSGQYVITTHSPYILSALNNLMYGAQLAAQSPDKRVRVARVLGDAALVPAENVRAYAFGDGQVHSIIDGETGLVRATMLDSVSNELAKEFEALVDIEFEELAA